MDGAGAASLLFFQGLVLQTKAPCTSFPLGLASSQKTRSDGKVLDDGQGSKLGCCNCIYIMASKHGVFKC